MSGKSSRVRKSRLNLPEGSGHFKTGLTPSVGRSRAVARILSFRGVNTIAKSAASAASPVISTTTYYLGYPNTKIVQPAANANIPPINVVIPSDAKQVKITAVGGHGGGGIPPGGVYGGRGAKVTITYNLTTINITLLKLYIGGGGFAIPAYGSGGGGLTQVMSDNNVAINVVAGGGGGFGTAQKGFDASNGLIDGNARGSNANTNGAGSRLVLDGTGGLGNSIGGFNGGGGFFNSNIGGGGGGYGGGSAGPPTIGGNGGGSIALLNGVAQPYTFDLYANNEALGADDVDGFVILEWYR